MLCSLLLSLCTVLGAIDLGILKVYPDRPVELLIADGRTCETSKLLDEEQIVSGEHWFEHMGEMRMLTACGAGKLELFLHNNCDDVEGRVVKLLPCSDYATLSLHAAGGTVFLRARGEGMLNAPTKGEYDARREEFALFAPANEGGAPSPPSPVLPPSPESEGEDEGSPADGDASRVRFGIPNEDALDMEPALPADNQQDTNEHNLQREDDREIPDVDSPQPPLETSAAEPTSLLACLRATLQDLHVWLSSSRWHSFFVCRG